MSLQRSRRHTNKRKSSSLSMLPAHQRFPKSIRNELRMTCALRGYSALREGDGKTLVKQYEFMNRFYHGHGNKSPSQIRMLAEGVSLYSDLYDEKEISLITQRKTNRGATTNQRRLCLKDTLSRDPDRSFYVGEQITYQDLEKKHRTGPSLINGRQLTDMAKRGMQDYRKALAFTKKKWDLKTNTPIESGTTVEDVIEYVRRRMYLSNVVKIDDDNDESNEKKNKDIGTLDNRSIDKNKQDMPKTIDIRVNVARGGTSNEDDNEENDNDKKRNKRKYDEDSDDEDDYNDESTDSEDDSDLDKKPSVDGKNKDDECYQYKEDNDDVDDEYDYNDDDDDDVPEAYIFNSYFAYILWGPFAEEKKKLRLFLLGK
jgi:hypothetical protein